MEKKIFYNELGEFVETHSFNKVEFVGTDTVLVGEGYQLILPNVNQTKWESTHCHCTNPIASSTFTLRNTLERAFTTTGTGYFVYKED
jgi:hypothetical protein